MTKEEEAGITGVCRVNESVMKHSLNDNLQGQTFSLCNLGTENIDPLVESYRLNSLKN